MTADFRFLEDVALADCAFEAWGDSPSELFQAAAQAVIETMVDPVTVSTPCTEIIEHEDPDLASLLFDWLSEIVYLKDAKGLAFRGATAIVLQDTTAGKWVLRGKLPGEPIDQERHDLRSDVKAVTKHMYHVRQDGSRWIATVVLDI